MYWYHPQMASHYNKIDFRPKLPTECANSRPTPKESIRGEEEKDSHPKRWHLEGTSPDTSGEEAMTNTFQEQTGSHQSQLLRHMARSNSSQPTGAQQEQCIPKADPEEGWGRLCRRPSVKAALQSFFSQ